MIIYISSFPFVFFFSFLNLLSRINIKKYIFDVYYFVRSTFRSTSLCFFFPFLFLFFFIFFAATKAETKCQSHLYPRKCVCWDVFRQSDGQFFSFFSAPLHQDKATQTLPALTLQPIYSHSFDSRRTEWRLKILGIKREKYHKKKPLFLVENQSQISSCSEQTYFPPFFDSSNFSRYGSQKKKKR